MRSFILVLTSVISVGLLATSSLAQLPPPKKADDPEKVLANLLRAVKQKDDVNARIEAAMGLAEFGPKAEPALADLLDALQTKNEDLRLNAAIALGKMGSAAIGPVAKLLDANDMDTKFYAIWTIGWIGPEAKATVPTIIKLMNDKNEGIRRKAAFALGRLAGDPDKTIAVLAEAFKDENDEVRQAAGDSLSKFGLKAVPPLIAILKQDTLKAQLQAATSLGEIGAEAKDAVPLLKERFLAKENANVHHYAPVLAKIGKASVPALEAGFKDARPEVRQAASQALVQVGADAVSVLVDSLGDKNVEVRRLAGQTLSQMRIGDKSVVIALAFALSDEDDNVKQQCIQALSILGAQAKLAGPKLKEALSDMNPNVRMQAYHLLNIIGESPKDTLLKALGSKNDKIRINTASLMVNVNYEPNTAMPILVEALKHEDLALKMQAAFTLAQRRQHIEKLMPLFVDGLKHKSSGVRMQAVLGLNMLGNFGSDAAPSLAEALRDSDANVRQQAVYALQNVRGKPETIVPILRAIFKDGDAGMRRSVVQIAYVYGPKAKDLVADAIKDKDGSVRQQAVYTLQNMQGDLSDILPLLVSMTKDENLNIRQQLVWLFQRTGEAGVPHLGELLKDSDPNIRTQAAAVLRNLGPKAAKAIPALKEAANDKNANVRLNVILALAATGSEGPDYLVKQFGKETDANNRGNLIQNLIYSPQRQQILPIIKVAMTDPEAVVRQRTIGVVTALGQNSKEGFEAFEIGIKDTDASVRNTAASIANFYGAKAWPLLEEALKTNKDSNFRQNALQNLQFSGYKSKSGVASITACLKDPNLNVRMMACNVLGNIGRDAADALPTLRELTNDTNVAVQNAARNAVNRIEPKK